MSQKCMSWKYFSLSAIFLIFSGCATLTNDPTVPIALSFSDGSSGECILRNKRGSWNANIPETVMVRRSDDALQYDCVNVEKVSARGNIPSRLGGKIVASAVFLDFGIVDAITDKHREYPPSFVIPIKKNQK
ncbi:MAG: hypothetical protein OXE94_15475 [Aestuariivita sp.]|nr:hypothetical protein [Aestuariivita sp.]MCY4201374.1 hypothetical protein [Aestuariivita sp.]MCY4290026.1 hypothetical protein [Aestuariivita sp.]MCY4346812.1 hypothetical protein [Aestuariivita sp.]